MAATSDTMNRPTIELEALTHPGYKLVVRASSPTSGYRGFIAVRSSKLGRRWAACVWARMHRPMMRSRMRCAWRRRCTYKSALAGLPFGGGKSVIVAAPGDRRDLLRAHATTIQMLAGRYVGAGNVGVSPADVEYMREFTPHLAREVSSELDSGYFTALGLAAAMRGTARMLWQGEDLKARTIVVQRCDKVGASLAVMLGLCGSAHVVVSDVDEARASTVARATGANTVAPERALSVPCDICRPVRSARSLHVRMPAFCPRARSWVAPIASWKAMT